MAKIKKVSKAQDGKKLKPNYSNIKGSGWDLFKTPTSKDSSDYRKGFDKKVKGEGLKQYPSPSGAEIRGYNEASERSKKPKAKNGKWIQKATSSIKRRGTEGVCTGSKFGGPTCKPGSKRYNLAQTFKKMSKAKKK
jgi:hypothetical protein